MFIYDLSCSIFVCDIEGVANITRLFRIILVRYFFVELLIVYFRITINAFVAGYLSDSLLFFWKRICEQKTCAIAFVMVLSVENWPLCCSAGGIFCP